MSKDKIARAIANGYKNIEHQKLADEIEGFIDNELSHNDKLGTVQKRLALHEAVEIIRGQA